MSDQTYAKEQFIKKVEGLVKGQEIEFSFNPSEGPMSIQIDSRSVPGGSWNGWPFNLGVAVYKDGHLVNRGYVRAGVGELAEPFTCEIPEVRTLPGAGLRPGGPRSLSKFTITIRNTSETLPTDSLWITVEHVGWRSLVAKPVAFDLLKKKLDQLWNDPQPVKMVLENRKTGTVGSSIPGVSSKNVYETFLVLQMDKEWEKVFGQKEWPLGIVAFHVENIVDVADRVESGPITIEPTIVDGHLGLKLKFGFPRNVIKLHVDALLAKAKQYGWAVDYALPDYVTVEDLSFEIILTLWTEKDPMMLRAFTWSHSVTALPNMEVLIKPAIRLSGDGRVVSADSFAKLLEALAMAFGLHIHDISPQLTAKLHSMAKTLVNFMIAEKDPQIDGTAQTLDFLVAEKPSKGPVIGLPPSGEQEILDPGNLSKIDHIVVLMMENRSFDTMLGYLSLPTTNGGLGRTDVNGLKGTEYNRTTGSQRASVFPLTDTVFRCDPNHSFDGNKRQRGGYVYDFIYGYPERAHPDEVGNCAGFVLDFERRIQEEYTENGKLTVSGVGSNAPDIMGYYTASQLPTYDMLAREYMISDAWHAVHPGHTWPNRFVTLTGALYQKDDGTMDPFNTPQDEFIPLDRDTIFDQLSATGVSWNYFEDDVCMLRLFKKYTFDEEKILPFYDDKKGFFAAAKAGTLPSVTFIDPDITDVPPGNDDHAPSDVKKGQALVQAIHDALVASPKWEKTMFIVTYDEHGGFFDHVFPEVDPALPSLCVDPDTGQAVHYRGFRVPTFIISPWVPQGSVTPKGKVYDHASIAKTIMARFMPTNAPGLGERVKQALDLGDALSLETPRLYTSKSSARTLSNTLEESIQLSKKFANKRRAAREKVFKSEKKMKALRDRARAGGDFHAGMTLLIDWIRKNKGKAPTTPPSTPPSSNPPTPPSVNPPIKNPPTGSITQPGKKDPRKIIKTLFKKVSKP